MRTYVVAFMYGEIPEHIKHVFHLNKGDFDFVVLNEGDNLPADHEGDQFLVLFGSSDHDNNKASEFAEQLKSLYNDPPAFFLQVETEPPPSVELVWDEKPAEEWIMLGNHKVNINGGKIKLKP